MWAPTDEWAPAEEGVLKPGTWGKVKGIHGSQVLVNWGTEEKSEVTEVPVDKKHLTPTPSLIARVLAVAIDVRHKSVYIIQNDWSVAGAVSQQNPVYDLKGSVVNRKAETTEHTHKDVNYRERFGLKSESLHRVNHTQMPLQDIIKRDTKFFEDHGILDYSLLVGMEEIGPMTPVETFKVQPRFYGGIMGIQMEFSKPNGSEILQIRRDLQQPELQVGDCIIAIGDESLLNKTVAEQDKLWALYKKDPEFNKQNLVVKRKMAATMNPIDFPIFTEKSLTALSGVMNIKNTLYKCHFGIIDFLQSLTTRKKFERIIKSGFTQPSAVPPKQYAERFRWFCGHHFCGADLKKLVEQKSKILEKMKGPMKKKVKATIKRLKKYYSDMHADGGRSYINLMGVNT